ncbi:hypothetical protein EJ06DRAFT_534024 [Trichodelitschia bisporula]|uniref:Uncharacterized protein n=1 Tax=Trichodelitschia bisporula TaxID=703511 RepID=A0A6G1HJV6_9PEZI|nr:hypothetical protein EJ06DRAFT_534024 [Trichodelitschia bisporula]
MSLVRLRSLLRKQDGFRTLMKRGLVMVKDASTDVRIPFGIQDIPAHLLDDLVASPHPEKGLTTQSSSLAGIFLWLQFLRHKQIREDSEAWDCWREINPECCATDTWVERLEAAMRLAEEFKLHDFSEVLMPEYEYAVAVENQLAEQEENLASLPTMSGSACVKHLFPEGDDTMSDGIGESSATWILDPHHTTPNAEGWVRLNAQGEVETDDTGSDCITESDLDEGVPP